LATFISIAGMFGETENSQHSVSLTF